MREIKKTIKNKNEKLKKDTVPENYIKFIEDEKFIEYAIKELKEEKRNTYKIIKDETNKYRKAKYK